MIDLAKKTISEFLSWVEKQQEICNALNHYTTKDNKINLFFRGTGTVIQHGNNQPCIYRPNEWLIPHEHLIYKEAIRKTPQFFINDHSTFDKLVRMQHFGIPTRLLDITSNPLLALFFSCDDSISKVGQVYAFFVSDKAIKYADSDAVSAVSNIALRPYSFDITYSDTIYKKYWKSYLDNSNSNSCNHEKYIKSFNANSGIGYLIHEIRAEKSYYQECIDRNDLETIWAVKPRMNNERIFQQDGYFLLFGILGKKSCCPQIPNIETALQYFELRRKLFPSCSERKKSIVDLITPRSSINLKDFEESHKGISSQIQYLAKCKLEINSKIAENNKLAKPITRSKFDFDAKDSSITSEIIGDYYACDKNRIALSKIAEINLMGEIINNGKIIFHSNVRIGDKPTLIESLELLGVTKDKLFPGLENVASFLKKKYSQKDPHNQ